jgi:hypothetical protein
MRFTPALRAISHSVPPSSPILAGASTAPKGGIPRPKKPSRFLDSLLPLDYARPFPSLPAPSQLTYTMDEQFLNRTAALALYRSFIRCTKGYGTLGDRREIVQWLRVDFEKYRGVVVEGVSRERLERVERELMRMWWW